MAISRSVDRSAVSVAETHLARVSADGSSRHRYLNALLEGSGANTARDLADSVHLLCGLHGSHPSLVELAHQNAGQGPARDWLARSWEIAHPAGTGGVYPNFPDSDLDDWDAAYHGANRERLLAVKRRYDPNGVFG